MSGVHHFTSHSIGLPSSWPTPDSQSVPFHQPIPPLIMTSRSSGGFSVVASWISISSFFMSLFQFTFLWPNQSPEPTGVGACSCSGSRRLFHIFWSPAAQLFSLGHFAPMQTKPPAAMYSQADLPESRPPDYPSVVAAAAVAELHPMFSCFD